MVRPSFRTRRVVALSVFTASALIVAACSSASAPPPAGTNGNGFGDSGTPTKHDATTPPVDHDAGHHDAAKKEDAGHDAGHDAKEGDAKTGDAKTGDAKDTDGSAEAAPPFVDAMVNHACTEGAECASGVCAPSAVVVNDAGRAPDAGNCSTHTCVCQAPSCNDGVKNGNEADVDCGGSCEKKCVDAETCNTAADCVSGVCGGAGEHDGGPGLCQPPSCSDGVLNGTETAVDCGSSGKCPEGETCQSCAGCTTGEDCNMGTDCTSGICSGTGGTCSCPTGMTEAATNVGVPYCIDNYEVTFGQYNEFILASVAVDTQPAECKPWNMTFEPQGLSTTPGTADEPNPVTNVNWCDAYMYCQYLNKHLCGTIALPKTSTSAAVPGGQPVPDDGTSPNDESVDEWYNACSNQGVNIYPYGNAYEPLACNGIDSPAQNSTGPVSDPPGGSGYVVDTSGPICILDNRCNNPIDQYQTVRSQQEVSCYVLAPTMGAVPACGLAFEESTCRNLNYGVFDMSGNVAEWENSCSGMNGESDTCNVRGGSFDSPDGSSSLLCAMSATAQPPLPRNNTTPDVGFRCCL
jgi:hypothetical protein